MKSFLRITLLHLFVMAQPLFAQQPKPLYQSETLQIQQLSANTFVHVSYLSTDDFGKVACNGMLVINEGEVLVFDTPVDVDSSEELITWLESDKKVRVKGVLATHFHDDCVGGLEAFHSRNIPSYGSFRTQSLAEAEGNFVPRNGFEEKLILQIGDVEVVSQFFGEGHTKDNVVSYVPSEQVLFGGCMIKELNSGIGFVGDANVPAWPATVDRVKSAFSDARIVIPGHGKVGDAALLDYTIQLFSQQ